MKASILLSVGVFVVVCVLMAPLVINLLRGVAHVGKLLGGA